MPVAFAIAVKVILKDEQRIEMLILKNLKRHEVKLADLLQAKERQGIGRLWIFFEGKCSDTLLQQFETIRVRFDDYINNGKHNVLVS